MVSDESFEPESSSVTVTPCTRQDCSPENEANAFSTGRGLSYLQEDQVSNELGKLMYDIIGRKVFDEFRSLYLARSQNSFQKGS